MIETMPAPHPVTDLFPMMGEEELVGLAEDIRQNGLQVPIVTHQGRILDGRNRLRACLMAGVSPRFEEWRGTGSPIAWVISVNLHRRHLTAGQKAAVAAEVLPHLEREAEERRRQLGRQAALRQHNPERVSQRVDEPTARSDQLAAEIFGVNRTYVSDAKRLMTKAPDLHERVKAGKIGIPDAKRQLQRREANAPRREPKPDRPLPVGDLPDGIHIEVGDAARLPLDPLTVDLIVTSPPYGLDKPYSDDEGSDRASDEDWRHNMALWLKEMLRVSKDGGRLAINVPLDTTRGGLRPTFAQAVFLANLAGWRYRSSIVWAEPNVSKSIARGSVDSPACPSIIAPVEMIALFSKGDWKRETPSGIVPDLDHEEWLTWTSGLWTFQGESHPWEGHPAAFPAELPYRLIRLLSFPGDTVLDPFVGSGTTALIAHQLGRQFYGFDLSPEFVESAKRRLQGR